MSNDLNYMLSQNAIPSQKHFGASLKDLSKKWFAFSKFDKEAFRLLDRIEKELADLGGSKDV